MGESLVLGEMQTDSNAPGKKRKSRVVANYSDEEDLTPPISAPPQAKLRKAQRARKSVTPSHLPPNRKRSHTSEEDEDIICDDVILNGPPNPKRQSRKEEIVAGVIEKLVLMNFMCHKSVVISFNKHVNFITGKNGSGKSAVLAGLVLGLGGTATKMGRGRAVKEYIMTGEQEAQIEITIVNEGPDAYKPENYGNRIIIQRTLSRVAGAKYKFMNAEGQKVTPHKGEMAKILAKLNISLENPVSVVTQEISREFLQNFKPKELYRFYMDSTKLELVRSLHMESKNKTRNLITRLSGKKETLEKEDSNLGSLKKKVEDYDKLKNRRDHLSKLAGKIKFAKLNKEKMSVEQLKTLFNNAQKEAQRLEGRVGENEASIMMKTDKVDQCKQKLKELSGEHQRISNDIKIKKKVESETRDKLGNVEREINCEKDKMKFIERDRQKLVEHIERLDNRQDFSDNIAQLNQQQKVEETKKYELENKEKENRLEMNSAKEKMRQVEEEIRGYRNEEKEYQDQLQRSRNERQEIGGGVSEVGGGLRIFGEQFVRLNHMIQQNVNRFSKLPKGPIGSYMKLRDESYGVACEKALGPGLLKKYICNTNEDVQELKKLMRQTFTHGFTPQITRTTFLTNAHDIERDRPQHENPTVLEVLDINDVDVYNIVVDQRSAHTTLLFTTPDLLRQCMRDNPPHHCAKGFDKDGNNATPRPRYVFYMNKDRRKQVQFLGKSVEGRIQQLDEEINEYQKRLKPIIEAMNRLNMRFRSAREKCQKFEGEMQDILKRKRRGEMEIQRLQKERSELETEQGQDTGIYRTQLNEKTAELEKIRDNAVEINQRLCGLREEALLAKEEVDVVKAELVDLSESTDPLQKEIERFSTEINILKRKKEKNAEQRDNVNKAFNKCQETLDIAEKKLTVVQDDFMANLPSGTSMNDFKTQEREEKLQADFEKLEATIRSAQESIGDINKIKKDLAEKQQIYDESYAMYKTGKRFLRNVTESLKLRDDKYKVFKACMAAKMRMAFISNMQTRKYRGNLSVNYEQGLIEITADTSKVVKDEFPLLSRPRESLPVGQIGAVQDLKGLSGGERSFTTVCFLLSLWECMDAPFRCVDEFDVFMDDVNRRMGIRMLLEFSKGTPYRPSNQFVILSPLDTSAIPDDTSVSLFEMDSPERNK